MRLRKPLFYCIAISIPFVIILLIELGLRALAYGNTYPLFIPATQFEGYWQTNPELIKRYFPAQIKAPSVAPDTYLFKKDKPNNTFRIVTMGGSTMAGFPYGRFGSPAGMLQQRFKASHPSRNIEIISVAMSSINTYTLLDISDEVIAIQPDAVLIYSGHNEYLGVMGVGSVYAGKGGHGANLLFLMIKELRIFQLLQSLYYSSVAMAGETADRSDAASNNTNNERTVMAKIAKNKNIAYKDTTYDAGLTQFSQNIDAILATFEKAAIPVFISNLVANESDQPPFASISDKHLDILTTKLTDNAYQSPISIDDINLANKLGHANYVYALAKAFAQSGDANSAHGYFLKAIDYDLLRFRAPQEFNAVIANAADKRGAFLVDAHHFLHQQSQASIGYSVMLEHLHPNHRGYFLLADAFYQSLVQQLLGEAEYPSSIEQAWQFSPLTAVDEIYANYKIAQLTSDYPFTKVKQAISLPEITDHITQLGVNRINGATWINTQQSLLAYYQKVGQFERAANVAGLLFDAIPNQHNTARIASLLYLKTNALAFAKYYALQAIALNPSDANYRLSLAEIQYKLGNTNEAIATLKALLEIDPTNQRAIQIKIQLQQ